MKTDLSPRANGLHGSYPLAYDLAVKASPRLKMFLLVLVIAPFWTSFLIRTCRGSAKSVPFGVIS